MKGKTMSHKTLEQDLMQQLITLNDLRLENKLTRDEYLIEFNKIMKVVNLFNVELFKENN